MCCSQCQWMWWIEPVYQSRRKVCKVQWGHSGAWFWLPLTFICISEYLDIWISRYFNIWIFWYLEIFIFLCYIHTRHSSEPGMPAPPHEKQALPRPTLWNWQTREAQWGKTDCRFHWWPLFITPTNYALEEGEGRREKGEGKFFQLTLCTDCDYLVHRNTFKKTYNVFFIKTS